jgi:hypothetical protein
MKIMMSDGREFQGTPLQMVRAMQDIAFAERRRYLARRDIVPVWRLDGRRAR